MDFVAYNKNEALIDDGLLKAVAKINIYIYIYIYIYMYVQHHLFKNVAQGKGILLTSSPNPGLRD